MKKIFFFGLITAFVGLVSLSFAKAAAKKTRTSKSMEHTLPSGLKYEELSEGTGDAAKAGNTVEVNYTGWLSEGNEKKGKKFDSSIGRGPFSFTIGQGRVIKGWEEGLVGMKVHGKRRLIIPPSLGYGDRAIPGAIPANSTLIFDIELLKIEQ